MADEKTGWGGPKIRIAMKRAAKGATKGMAALKKMVSYSAKAAAEKKAKAKAKKKKKAAKAAKSARKRA